MMNLFKAVTAIRNRPSKPVDQVDKLDIAAAERATIIANFRAALDQISANSRAS